jgi:hypothetical protein
VFTISQSNWKGKLRVIRTSQKAALFEESVIREMTRLFLARAANPASISRRGSPISRAGSDERGRVRAIQADINQYAVTWGA